MYKIGLSSCAPLCSALFEKYRNAGITAMEISLDYAACDALDYACAKRLAEEFEVDLWSFHLPFSPFVKIDLSNAALCKNTIQYYETLIKKASEIGIQRFVVHPSGEPIADENRPERMKCAKESLAAVAQIAQRHNAVIAVENLPRTCLGKNSDEITELISVHENLKVCFDTNHLPAENPSDFIHKVGNRIITTHISDYDFVNERHWLPGEGKVDWQSVLRALKAVNYDGVWLYEIDFLCPKTILRSRDLTCDDFVKNASEIFENKALTVFSTHKENLGMWE